jgi:hypothetical protein
MSEQFVSVPVPIDRVTEVYRLLASPSSPNGIPAPDATTTTPPAEDWSWLAEHTYEKVEWPIKVIHRAVTESNAGQRAFLKYLAEHSSQWLTTALIAAGLGLERKDIAGGLSGLTRRAKSRYGVAKWFFSAQWDGTQYSYRMDEREAAAVLEILAR